MSESVNLRVPLKIIGGDGTKIAFQGAGLFGIVYIVKLTSALVAGDGVVHDTAASVLSGGSFVAAADTGFMPEQIYSGKIGPTAKLLPWWGVAASDGAVGQEIPVLGVGSIAFGNVAAGANTPGHNVNQSGATAGKFVTAATAETNPSTSLGYVVKTSGTTGGVTDTGSSTKVGLIVQPHGA